MLQSLCDFDGVCGLGGDLRDELALASGLDDFEPLVFEQILTLVERRIRFEPDEELAGWNKGNFVIRGVKNVGPLVNDGAGAQAIQRLLHR
ncbi:MAG TPA: hypothetical protein VHK68_04500 [Gemmatimonadales bacterium]|nr:hypothetical protein [Gemmatimonadales bacterium]